MQITFLFIYSLCQMTLTQNVFNHASAIVTYMYMYIFGLAFYVEIVCKVHQCCSKLFFAKFSNSDFQSHCISFRQ